MKILQVHSVEGAAFDIIVNATVNSVKKFNIKDKIICFCCDNTNKNLEGEKCRGKNNVLTKLRNLWSRNVLGIGCGARMIHKCVKTNCDILLTEIGIVVKIYKYFSIYTEYYTTKLS
jgi:hypothetical protein